ncbi:MAG: DUF448 domain-containing protein [Armatimonadota bacterium]
MTHTPIRTCVACKRKRPAGEMLRVRKVNSAIRCGSGPGRGAWVCPDEKCVARMFEKRLLLRALRVESMPSDWEQCMGRLLEMAKERNAEG